MRKGRGIAIEAALAALLWAGVLVGVAAGDEAPPEPVPAEPAPPAAPAPDAAAPEAPVPPAAPDTLAGHWRNFLHWIQMGKPPVALSFGQAILSANPKPRELYQLWAQTEKSADSLARGLGDKQLAPVARKIAELVEAGAIEARTDQAEIAKWIKMLGETPRALLLGTERLLSAGEFAIPQLIAALADVNTAPLVRERIMVLLPRFGKDAVRPLCEALACPDPVVKEVVCRSLGSIGYAHAAPYLRELAEQKGLAKQTREVALGAVAATAGQAALGKPVAEMFYALSLKYYDRADSLQPDQRYETANVWYWQQGTGLVAKIVPRQIFDEICAMRTSEKTLEHDGKFFPAACLWVAANYRREANLDKYRVEANKPDAQDPTRAAGAPSAAFYGLAGGARINQVVLGRALADSDIPVAMRAIDALALTASGPAMVAPVADGAQPLVAALTHSSKLLRFKAAEVLAEARPERRFTGWELVVPVLVEALRQTGAPTAVLADPNQERRNKVKDLLRLAKYTVADAADVDTALDAARKAGGADLAVLASDVAGPAVGEALTMMRSEPALRTVRVVILARDPDVKAAEMLAKADPLVAVLPERKLDAQSLTDVLQRQGAGADMTPEEAAAWAIKAADELGMLAATATGVYDLAGATKSLAAALSDKRDDVRIAAAKALSEFRCPEAQRGLADLAGAADAAEPVRLVAYNALAKSVRLLGNQLTEKQIGAVMDVVKSDGSLKVREAAAQVNGALGKNVETLILSTK